jgi:hypothetical protein
MIKSALAGTRDRWHQVRIARAEPEVTRARR